jgi:hypothetical protein
MKRILLYTLVFITTLTACEKTVTTDVPKKDPKLVIKGLLEKNDIITVTVGKSRGVLEPVSYQTSLFEQYTVKNAVPVIYENGAAIDTLVYVPADYEYRAKYNSRVRDGFLYTIRVTAPGFTMAEASSLLPSQSVITEVRRVKNARTDIDGNLVDDITIKLDDPAAEKNFYLVQVWAATGSMFGTRIWCVSSTDKDLEAIGEDTDPLAGDNCFDGSSLLMKDVNFNGAQKQLKISVQSMELQDYRDSQGGWHRPYIKVFRITEDQFKYVKSYNTYTTAGDNPFAEPANVFSNIKNGYGIFAVSTAAVDTLR